MDISIPEQRSPEEAQAERADIPLPTYPEQISQFNVAQILQVSPYVKLI